MELRRAASLEQAVRVEAAVLLLWRTQGVDAAGRETTLHGQHHVTVDLLGASAATYPAPAEPEPRPPVTIIPAPAALPPAAQAPGADVLRQLVSVVPLHRPTVQHDFDRKRVCVIPVTMLLQNHSACDLVVHLSAVSATTSSPRSPLPYSSHVSAELTWVGRTHPHMTVAAGGSARLSLAAAVTRPGLYDLGAVGVACRPADDADAQLTEQTARVESAVVVRGVTAGERG
ncbi:trafficking protein particle complex subunit 8-like [Pollicipes pollicipes]|uniref:trafficking protein particle complex subunit 8-like n=1 Tax=Pollicipes pollicipes TaxID=41117 RepID=UPI001884FC9E|nr:trafficking protein particle complex subunit 8-like [Pollicipes pollicipes]